MNPCNVSVIRFSFVLLNGVSWLMHVDSLISTEGTGAEEKRDEMKRGELLLKIYMREEI